MPHPFAIDMCTLGNALASLRLQRNWSQQALAQRAGLSRATIARLESGQSVGLHAFWQVLWVLDMQQEVFDMIHRQVQNPVASSLDQLEHKIKPRQRGRNT